VTRYDYGHRKLRAALLPRVYEGQCPRCGGAILPGQDVDLDHVDSPVVYGGGGRRVLSHASCNRRAGGQLAAARRRARRGRRIRPVIAEVAVGAEISQDRAHTSVAAAGYGPDGSVVVELTHYLDGPGAGVAAIEGLRTARTVLAVVVDPHSQAATLIRPLRAAGVTVTELKTTDLPVAHGGFLDALNAGRLRHVEAPELTAAVRAGQSRPMGGGSTWARRGALVDVSPLTAATWAVWGLLCVEKIPEPEIF
jgi:hypothetical protein